MQIVCPNCTTAYDVPAAKFGGAGRSVRCARCRTVWVATAASEPVKKVAATDAVSSVALAVAEEREGGEFDWSFRAASTEEGAPAPNAEPADAGGGLPRRTTSTPCGLPLEWTKSTGRRRLSQRWRRRPMRGPSRSLRTSRRLRPAAPPRRRRQRSVGQ